MNDTNREASAKAIMVALYRKLLKEPGFKVIDPAGFRMKAEEVLSSEDCFTLYHPKGWIEFIPDLYNEEVITNWGCNPETAALVDDLINKARIITTRMDRRRDA